jgi:hypothetical protein
VLAEAVGSVAALRRRTFRLASVFRMCWRVNFVPALVRIVAVLNQLGLIRLTRTACVMRSPCVSASTEHQRGTQEQKRHPLCD